MQTRAISAVAVTSAAALYTLAAPPYAWWPAGWLVPGILLAGTRGLGPRAAALAGLAYGTLIGWGVCGWLRGAAQAYFAVGPATATAVALGAWAAHVGVPCALMLVAWSRSGGRVPPALRPFLGAWLWAGMEYLRGSLFGGMPWFLLGHSQLPNRLLVQVADVGGVLAISFLVALLSVSVAELVAAAPRPTGAIAARRLAPAAALVVGTLVYGAWAIRAYAGPPAGAETRTMAVVQGNVPTRLQWKREHIDDAVATYERYSRRARRERPDLVVWPENAVNFYLAREPRLAARLARVASATRDGLLVGGPRLAPSGEARNAVYLVGPRGDIRGHYDKRRLVPFAEYDPLGLRATPTATDPAYGSGAGGAPFDLGGIRVGTVICYEVLFPALVRDLVRHGAGVLVNVANDSWLDPVHGVAARQHFAMAAFRAIETRRWLVRAATSGPSGFVDPLGDVHRTIPADRAGTASATVTAGRGETLYVRFGDAWIVVAGLALAAAAHRPRAA